MHFVDKALVQLIVIMKTNQSIPRKPKKVEFIVLLIRENKEGKDKDDEKIVKFKLCNQPTEATSTLRETSILPFDEGTPERFIKWKLKTAEIQLGLNNTTGPSKYQTISRV